MTGTKDMELHEKDFKAVGEYVQDHLDEWLKNTETGKAAEALRERDIAVRESQVRLETELKAQRELLQQNMAFMEKRFEQVDKRFEQVDKRFEQVDKRFEEILHYMDKRFEQVDRRFEQMDKRFEDMLSETRDRFSQVDRRLESLETSLRRFIYSSFSFTALAAGVIIAVLKMT